MNGEADISRAAAMVANPARATVLAELMDGCALPPSELAELAGVSRATISEHLSMLEKAGFLRVERGGRNRYFRIAGPEIAHAVEALAAVAPRRAVRSLRQANRAGALAAARTCYGHLAGRLGVGLTDAMADAGLIVREDSGFALTERGAARLQAIGLSSPPSSGKPCNDWSERRPHLAGPLGVAVAKRLFELDWLRRGPTRRSVVVTESGKQGFRDRFGLTVAERDGT